MKSVMYSWEILYWFIPKTMGTLIKTNNADYGWGPYV